MEAQPNIQIKGIRDGLLIVLSEGQWPVVQGALLEQIDSQSDFMRGARVALDVGNQILKAVDLGVLRDELSERGITLWAVISNSPTTESTAQTLGMATRLSKPRPDRSVLALNTNLQGGEAAVLVERTLRSGYSLQHPGHIVIIGDVNPGAQVIAGGSVVVWGRLRGMVHAGADGDEEAIVCALDLTPTQLRIAGQIATPPQRRGKTHPELVRMKDGKLVAVAWDPKK